MLRNIADFESVSCKIQIRQDQNKKIPPRYNIDLSGCSNEVSRLNSLGATSIQKILLFEKYQKIKTFLKCSEIPSNKKTKRKKTSRGMGCIFQNLLELAFFIEQSWRQVDSKFTPSVPIFNKNRHFNKISLQPL